jgi:hypothetical protein
VALGRWLPVTIRLMDIPVQEWLLKLEVWLKNAAGEWRGTKETVIDESAALANRLDRIEKKVDDVLAELRQKAAPES